MKSKIVSHTIIIFTSLILTCCDLQPKASPPTDAAIAPALLLNTSTVVIETSTSTAQLTQTPTITPVPTLFPEDALETFINLIEKDGNCSLPCWLGAIPGHTRFNDVLNQFSQFNAIAYTEFSSERAFMRVFFPDFKTAIQDTTTIVAPASDGKVLQVWVYTGVNPKGLVGYPTYDYPEYQQLWQKYFVPGIFAEHGQPEIILLDTTLMQAGPSATFPFSLWIIYPHEGFLLRYDGINNIVGENIRICPMLSSIQIEIWDIKKLSYQELIQDEKVGGISNGPKPIESVTDFEIEAFYNLFKNGDIDTCFDTSAAVWPPN